MVLVTIDSDKYRGKIVGKIISMLIIKVWLIAFIIASFTMNFQKISNILSIASFVLIVSSLTSAFIGYKYLSSEQFKNKLMKQIMNNVSSQIMPKALENALPSSTGISIPKF